VFDLQSSQRRQLLDKVAQAIVFGWSTHGRYLAASLHGAADGAQYDGIWMLVAEQVAEGKTSAEQTAAFESGWWHIPGSDQCPSGGSIEPLESLRRMQPVWNADASKLAYPLSSRVPSDSFATGHATSIAIAQPQTRQVDLLLTTREPLRDLRWHPDGRRLGFIEGTLELAPAGMVDTAARENVSSSTLKIVDEAGMVSEPLADSQLFATSPLRQFVGWNASGEYLAVVAPIAMEEYECKWSVLFPAIPAARDRVLLFDPAKSNQPHMVHEGMRITFPQWSPTANQLSLWGTFTPTHRSWLSMFLPASLRPGDPAAILDVDTGELSWLAINRHEQSQVGHYYLLKQDYAQAWEWYVKGAEGRSAPQPQALQSLMSPHELARLSQEPWFFEYYCLLKLGRHDEAQGRLSNFRRAVSFELPSGKDELFPGIDPSDPTTRNELQYIVDMLTPLIQASLASEIFLSLNASDDGVNFFRQQLAGANCDAERFAAAVCLAQMLLVSGDHGQYAQFATEGLLPLVEQRMADQQPTTQWRPNGNDIAAWREQVEGVGLLLISGMSCLPLASAEFQSTLDEAQVRELLPAWQAFAGRSLLPVDVIVIAMLERLGEATIDARALAAQKQPWLPDGTFQIETPQQADEVIVELSQLFHRQSAP
jgi:hypothetical protein